MMLITYSTVSENTTSTQPTGRGKKLQSHNELELYGRICGHIHARICPRQFETLTPHSRKIPAILPTWTCRIKYGKKGAQKFSTAPETSPHLTMAETKHIQSTTGSFLYYGRAKDYSILPALNDIASAQAQPTIKTKQKAKILMDYLHTFYTTL